MLITKTVKMKWNARNKQWFQNKGYIFSGMGREFEVNAYDLSEGSHVSVDVECDCCGQILRNVLWQSYKRYLKPNDEYYCNTCATILFAGTNIKKTRLKNTISFKQWCIDNNHTDALSRWDYELNRCNPDDICYSTATKYYFKCSRGLHKSELKHIASYTHGQDGSLNCCTCQSFGQWLLDNHYESILQRWDYELNNQDPFNVSYGTKKKYYFKCPRGIHESELTSICDFIGRNNGLIYCRQCNSFEQWCIENNRQDVLDRWDYELNEKKPNEVSFGTSKHKYYFKCPKEIHKSELKSLNSFTNGNNGGIDCVACNSFAQWGIDNLGQDFLEKYWDYQKNTDDPWKIKKASNGKVWLKCQARDYHKSYNVTPFQFIDGSRCSYCNSNSGKVHYLDSLATTCPVAILLWSNKNTNSPYQYKQWSGKEVYWKCENGIHEDYSRVIHSSNRFNFRCPECMREREESILQEKVRLYLKSMNFCVLHENKCTILPSNPKRKGTNSKLPYDNEIVELKLIIEVHGEQHYQITGFHKMHAKRSNTTPEYQLHYQKLKDRYKRIYAKSNGYNYLEIPYWTDNEQDEWKQLIDNKINEIIHKNKSS